MHSYDEIRKTVGSVQELSAIVERIEYAGGDVVEIEVLASKSGTMYIESWDVEAETLETTHTVAAGTIFPAMVLVVYTTE